MKKVIAILFVIAGTNCFSQNVARQIENFDKGWKFILDSAHDYSTASTNDASWRTLNLPHDWSIELPFDKNSPTGTGGGALRGGMGWYRKTFSLPASSKNKNIFIDFDGVYMNSEVWINGHSLGVHPYGYTSFRYNLTPYLTFDKPNIITVKVDNSKQPNSRWYSGSGIYRNVWLVSTGAAYVDHWGTYVTTTNITGQSATINVNTVIHRTGSLDNVLFSTIIYDANNNPVARKLNTPIELNDSITNVSQQIILSKPVKWSLKHPYLYKVVTELIDGRTAIDDYITKFGVRTIDFDVNNGFSLNGEHVKINGVCDHHDLGCLGTAINKRALERQFEILKGMGVNALRTSHNPPAPEVLDLCDSMGILVMDEAFDMWKEPKNPYDYHLYWDEWHEKDLRSMVLRDRNHPSIIIWSIGNEIPEQWGGNDGKDSSGKTIARELASIIRSLDNTRFVTSACNAPDDPHNQIIQSGALDLIGYNYHHEIFAAFPQTYPNKKFIATETVSSLATRGHYDMPSDSIRRWPERWDKPFDKGNPDTTCSAYDNCSAPWGSTQEETWKVIKKYNFLSGQFIWTGFDYIGEPTPYPWPARSSYFGLVDLAGFPKDLYYMYKSEWTDEPVLHIFPHWNWKAGDIIDVWAYYNHADAVELFLNGKSSGVKKKQGDDLHVMWRVPYEPGTLKAVSTNNGKKVLTQEVKTAGAPVKIVLTADRNKINADGADLSFVTVSVTDKDGNVVPDANNLVRFNINGEGFIAGLDNGSETDLESFRGTQHKTFNGLGLAVIQSNGNKGKINLQASADGLQAASIEIKAE